MASPTLDVPVFDADNHLYETKDAFTKFLPDRYNLLQLQLQNMFLLLNYLR